jgi:hypothetical protein
MITKDLSKFDLTALEEAYKLLKEVMSVGYPRCYELDEVEFEYDSSINTTYFVNKQGQRLALIGDKLTLIKW